MNESIEQSLRGTVVIIPMLNEEGSIGLVLDDLPAVREVIVVDNGSTDQSPAIATEHGATVIHEARKGYGSACLAGLDHVEEQIDAGGAPPDIIVFIDGDYSDHPDELTELVRPIVEDEIDMVIGSRMSGDRERGAMPVQAMFGNWLASTLMWCFWGAKFTDLGPFRAIRYQSLRKLGMKDTNFGWTVEMQIKAVRHQLRYTEIPVRYRCRIGASKISGTISGTVKAGYKILYTIFRYRLGFG